MTQNQKSLELAKDIALTIGIRIREIVADNSIELEVKNKSSISDLVTKFDVWADQEITKRITEIFPEHVVIGEESYTELEKKMGNKLPEIVNSNICWIVDPIDGTSNFTNRLPHSAICIGLVDRGVRVCGVVYDPYRQEMFTAIKGEGAFLNDKKIAVSSRDKLINCLVGIHYPNDRWTKWEEYEATTLKLIMSCRNIRTLGAGALDFCWAACGRLDGCFEYKLKPWDVAASSLILEEAGGYYSSMGKGDRSFNLFGEGFLGCNPRIKDEFRALLEETLK